METSIEGKKICLYNEWNISMVNGFNLEGARMLYIRSDLLQDAFLNGSLISRNLTHALEEVGVMVYVTGQFGGGGAEPRCRELLAREDARKLCLVNARDGYSIGQRMGATVLEIKLTPEELRAQFETLAAEYAHAGWQEVWSNR